jgi:hypothetical protein
MLFDLKVLKIALSSILYDLQRLLLGEVYITLGHLVPSKLGTKDEIDNVDFEH